MGRVVERGEVGWTSELNLSSLPPPLLDTRTVTDDDFLNQPDPSRTLFKMAPTDYASKLHLYVPSLPVMLMRPGF